VNAERRVMRSDEDRRSERKVVQEISKEAAQLYQTYQKDERTPKFANDILGYSGQDMMKNSMKPFVSGLDTLGFHLNS